MSNPQEVLTAINAAEMDKFNNIYLPMLEEMQASLYTRRDEYVTASDKGVKDTTDLYMQQMRINNEVTGTEATGEQSAASKRLASLQGTSASVGGANYAVDTADNVNKSLASGLLNIGTNVTNSAISDASAASGLATSREVNNANNAAAAKAQNQQMLGLGAGLMLTMV